MNEAINGRLFADVKSRAMFRMYSPEEFPAGSVPRIAFFNCGFPATTTAKCRNDQSQELHDTLAGTEITDLRSRGASPTSIPRVQEPEQRNIGSNESAAGDGRVELSWDRRTPGGDKGLINIARL